MLSQASRDIQQEPSLQSQYMQLLPLAPRVEPSESTDNTTSSHDYMPLSPYSRSWEVARNTITVNKVIGKGAFGQVAKGTAANLPGKKGKITVAIKMLKSKSLGHMFSSGGFPTNKACSLFCLVLNWIFQFGQAFICEIMVL